MVISYSHGTKTMTIWKIMIIPSYHTVSWWCYGVYFPTWYNHVSNTIGDMIIPGRMRGTMGFTRPCQYSSAEAKSSEGETSKQSCSLGQQVKPALNNLSRHGGAMAMVVTLVNGMADGEGRWSDRLRGGDQPSMTNNQLRPIATSCDCGYCGPRPGSAQWGTMVALRAVQVACWNFGMFIFPSSDLCQLTGVSLVLSKPSKLRFGRGLACGYHHYLWPAPLAAFSQWKMHDR